MDSSEVCWKFKIFPLRALVLPMGKNFHGTFVPHVGRFLALVKPLFHLPREREGKHVEPYASWCDFFDENGVAQLKEVLKVCTVSSLGNP
jgi:hypothetical protein